MPRPLSEQWLEAAQTWTSLESAANLLEDTKSAVMSQMMLKHGDVPVSRAEMMVKASSEWDAHIKAISKARNAANLAKVKADFLKMKFQEQMSREATDRLEARL